MSHGRDDEAIAFLVKYHGNGDPNARLVRLEVEEMKEGIRIDGIDKRWWDCKSPNPSPFAGSPIITYLEPWTDVFSNLEIDRPFFMSHSGRWRFLQVIMISVFGQWSGNGLGYFNATLFSTIGYTSSSTQLLLNIINSIVSAVGALTAVCLTDRMPRRPVLIWGTFGEFYHLMSRNPPAQVIK